MGFEKFAENVVTTAKKGLDIAEKKIEISNLKQDIKNLIYDLGTGYLSGDDKESLDSIVLEIHDKETKLATYQGEIDEALNLKKCPACESVNSKESLFCNKCGSKLDLEETTKQEETPED